VVTVSDRSREDDINRLIHDVDRLQEHFIRQAIQLRQLRQNRFEIVDEEVRAAQQRQDEVLAEWGAAIERLAGGDRVSAEAGVTLPATPKQKQAHHCTLVCVSEQCQGRSTQVPTRVWRSVRRLPSPTQERVIHQLVVAGELR
jgi:hypothetical protein